MGLADPLGGPRSRGPRGALEASMGPVCDPGRGRKLPSLRDRMCSARHDWEPLARSLNSVETEILMSLLQQVYESLEAHWRPVTELNLSIFQ